MKHITHQQVMTKALQNPEFRAIWQTNATKRKVTSAIIGERIKRRMTQEQLAKKAGLKQPSLARVESGGVLPSIATLDKIARALGRTLEIRFA